ncbi:MAG: hypothetical protein HY363_00455 [Candidatus Aenigmarchaeota archaeon]|nr:hypothetical protein [Candidatus Aenigmarchaeota archaeon]
MAKKINDLLQDAEIAKRKSDKDISKLVVAIRRGESTGNPIKDFVIACSHVLKDSYLEKKLTAVQDEIRNNQGEQFLIIEREEIIEAGNCWTPDVHQCKYQNSKLGVIRGELCLDSTCGIVRIPISPHAEQEYRQSKWNYRGRYPTIGHFDILKVNSWTEHPWEKERSIVYLPQEEDNVVKRRIIKTIVGKEAVHWYFCHPFLWQSETAVLPNKKKIAAYLNARKECHPRYVQALQTLHIEYKK